MSISIDELALLWLRAKEDERRAIDLRREVEDAMCKLANFSEQTDGTENLKTNGYLIKIVGRIDRKVDADKLQQLAAEHGLTEHITSLFRWKPEINMSVWKNADEKITKPLAAAITAKPSRPSFSIKHKE